MNIVMREKDKYGDAPVFKDKYGDAPVFMR